MGNSVETINVEKNAKNQANLKQYNVVSKLPDKHERLFTDSDIPSENTGLHNDYLLQGYDVKKNTNSSTQGTSAFINQNHSKTHYDFSKKVPSLIPRLLNESNTESLRDANLTEYLDNNAHQYHQDIISNDTANNENFDLYMSKIERPENIENVGYNNQSFTIQPEKEKKDIKEFIMQGSKIDYTREVKNKKEREVSDLDRNINFIKILLENAVDDNNYSSKKKSQQQILEKIRESRFYNAVLNITFAEPTKYVKENNRVYWGMYDKQLRNGAGYYVLESGEIICGLWNNDELQRDECYIFYPDKRVYFGAIDDKLRKFKDGCIINNCDSINNCVKTTDDHNKPNDVLLYIGGWLKDKQHGEGQEEKKDGTIFTCTWSHGMKEGMGKLFYKNKLLFVGGYKEGMKNGEGQLMNQTGYYKGNYLDDMMHGIGNFINRDGSKYIGHWYRDRKDGFGTFLYKDGRKYKGEFKDNQFEGKGTHTWPDGRKYIGSWRNDLMDGDGKLYYPNNVVYEGRFLGNRMHDQEGCLYRLSDKGNTILGGNGKVLIKKGHWHYGEFRKNEDDKESKTPSQILLGL